MRKLPIGTALSGIVSFPFLELKGTIKKKRICKSFYYNSKNISKNRIVIIMDTLNINF